MFPVLHPLMVMPLILKIGNNRGGFRSQLRTKSEGIRFDKVSSLRCSYVVFISFSGLQSRQESCEHTCSAYLLQIAVFAGVSQMFRVLISPAIKIPNDFHRSDIRRPYCKPDSVFHYLRAEMSVRMMELSRIKQIEQLITQSNSAFFSLIHIKS